MEIKKELTEREKEVLISLGEGHSRYDIAKSLNIEKTTVDKHVEAIFRKFGVQEKVGATVMGIYYEHLDIETLAKVFLNKKGEL